jgi:molybdopterin molybdotransferase
MIDVCSQEKKPLMPLEQALKYLTETIKPVTEVEFVSLPKALGRQLAQPLYASTNLPYERNAAMDGYAFASELIQPENLMLTCIGTSWAGHPFVGQLGAGECIRIYTGAVVPEQADSVIMQEQVSVAGKQISLPPNPALQQNVRNAGEDVKQGDCLLQTPKKLSAYDLGLLASAGVDKVPVYRQIRIAYFSTGDELIPLDEPLQSGKIYDSNRYTLAALLVDPCYRALDFGVLPDNKQLILDKLAAAREFDAIITSGGVSVGDADLVKDALTSCGQINFWKIAIKPGKPFAFGTIGNCHFFGLPGNPIAVITTYQQLVVPALNILAGGNAPSPLRLKATLTAPIKKSPGRQEFQRGLFNQDASGNLFVAAIGGQGSHMLGSMSKANCFIVLAADSSSLEAGCLVLIEPFH